MILEEIHKNSFLNNKYDYIFIPELPLTVFISFLHGNHTIFTAKHGSSIKLTDYAKVRTT